MISRNIEKLHQGGKHACIVPIVLLAGILLPFALPSAIATLNAHFDLAKLLLSQTVQQSNETLIGCFQICTLYKHAAIL